MTCPNCGVDLLAEESSRGLCPRCGAVLSSSLPDTPMGQQVLPAKETHSSSGPLLTGSAIVDKAFGFLGEITSYALIIYALVILIQGMGSIITVLCYLATAAFLLWHTQKMSDRYPIYSQGWLAGRTIQGKVWNVLLTFLYGIAVLIVLFPLGISACTIGMHYGSIGWAFALLIAYILGFLLRRMAGNKQKGNKVP